MNSFYRDFGPKPAPQPAMPMQSNLMSAIQNAMGRARNLIQTAQDPRRAVFDSFPNIPAEIRDDSDKILNYLLQNNMLNQLQLQAMQIVRGR